MGRQEILNRIRNSEDRSWELPQGIPAPAVGEELVRRFQTELEQVGGIFRDARGPDGLVRALQALHAECETDQFFWEPELISLLAPHFSRIPEETSPETLFSTCHPGGNFSGQWALDRLPASREVLNSVELSLSLADGGLAETGTVVYRVGKAGRLLSVLPPKHAVVVPSRRLFPSLATYLESEAFPGSSSAGVLVTGPSRTADIEKTLVMGVHGPGRWFVVLVD